MSEPHPGQVPLLTNTLKAGITYGIASLGSIPTRYGKARFPSIRRTFADSSEEKRLIKIGKGILPTTFALGSFSELGKPASAAQGNAAALRTGVNLVSKSGSKVAIHGSYVEITCDARIYAHSMDDLFDWIGAVLEYPTIKGTIEFNDGITLPVTVRINTSFPWQDPMEQSEGGPVLDRLFSIGIQLSITTISARISTSPVFKSTFVNTSIDGGETISEMELSADEIDLEEEP